MGKLVEMLHQVTQGSNSGIGFFAHARVSTRTARPAALLVAGGKGDVAALQAAVDNGADGVALSDWSPATTGTSGLIESVRSHESVWGVTLSEQYREGTLKAAQEQGAAFAVLGAHVPATALFEELDRFDLVVTVDPPQDDVAMLALRAVNLLPAQGALLTVNFTSSALAGLSIADFTRLRLLRESLRFPALFTLQGVPEAAELRTLIRLGADGLVLSGAGSSASSLGQQVKGLIAALEKTPARRESEETVLLSGLLGIPSRPATPEPEPGRRPEREPEEP